MLVLEKRDEKYLLGLKEREISQKEIDDIDDAMMIYLMGKKRY
jgi:hypothetical protein